MLEVYSVDLICLVLWYNTSGGVNHEPAYLADRSKTDNHRNTASVFGWCIGTRNGQYWLLAWVHITIIVHLRQFWFSLIDKNRTMLIIVNNIIRLSRKPVNCPSLIGARSFFGGHMKLLHITYTVKYWILWWAITQWHDWQLCKSCAYMWVAPHKYINCVY